MRGSLLSVQKLTLCHPACPGLPWERSPSRERLGKPKDPEDARSFNGASGSSPKKLSTARPAIFNGRLINISKNKAVHFSC